MLFASIVIGLGVASDVPLEVVVVPGVVPVPGVAPDVPLEVVVVPGVVVVVVLVAAIGVSTTLYTRAQASAFAVPTSLSVSPGLSATLLMAKLVGVSLSG